MAINFFDQSIPFWNTNTTYAQYEIVSYLGIIYSSKSSQAGNNPASDTTNTYWNLAGGGGVPNGLVGTTTVSAMKVVYATSTGTIQHADYSAELTTTAIGISTYGNTTGLTVAYQPSGLLKSFSTGMTPGLPLFLGASGAVITDPTTIPIGYYRVMIGYAINATDIMINLSEPVQVLANNVVKVGLGRVTQWPITTASLPSNMIPLDGRAISRTFYADLYALWGTTYGTGDGTSTFNVIDWTSLYVKDSTGATIGYWVVQAFPDTVIVTATAVASATSYITNGDFENSTTGWATYYDGSATASPAGTITGTAANLNFARNTTTPLFGTGDFKLNQTGTSKGAGLTYDFTLDPGLLGQVMSLSFYYKTIDVSGTAYVDSDFSVFLYDITNSSFIPLSTSGISRSTAASKFYASWFPSTSTRYRIFIHQTSTTTGVYSLELDRVDVSAQTTPNAAAVGAWIAYTPTFSAGFGTVVTPEFFYKRVADTISIRGRFNTGTVAASAGTFSLPSGLTIPSSYSYNLTKGSWRRNNGTASTAKRGTFEIFMSDSLIYFRTDGDTLALSPFATANVSSIMSSSEAIALEISEVPIAQWTTNINLATDFTEYASNDGSGGIAANTNYSTGSVQGISGSTAPAINAVTVSAGQFTGYVVTFARPVQVADKIDVEIVTSAGTTQWYNSAVAWPWVVQGAARYGITWNYYSADTSGKSILVMFGNGGAANTSTYGLAGGVAWTGIKWRVRKVSNGNMAEVPPVVRAEYSNSAGGTSDNPVPFSTKVEDTHSAFTLSTGRFTAPISGAYLIEGNFVSTTVAANFRIWKNGSVLKNIGATVAGATYVVLMTTVRLIAGDYIDIRPQGAASSSSVGTTISITRIGS
jgi:microcystin-dependent protein